MKQVSTLLCVLFFISLLNAQDIEVATVPAAVIDEFTLLYPDAKAISWQLNEGIYKAVFKNNKMSTIALLSAEGLLVQTETRIKTCALPEQALSYLADNYTDKKIEEASILQDETGIITFEAVIDKLDFTFDSAGEVMGMNAVVLESPR